MKKFPLILALMLLLSFIMASADTKQYTFEAALKQALEKNVELMAIVQRTEIAQKQIELANKTASSEKDRFSASEPISITREKRIRLYPLQRQWDLDKLTLDTIDLKQKIELDVIKGMYAIDRATKSLANVQSDRTLMEKELTLLKAKFKLGLVTQLQIDSQQSTIDKNTLEISIQERALQKQYVSFNHILGNPLATTIKLGTLPNLKRQEKTYDLTKISAYNYDHATAVLDKQKQLEFKKIERDIIFEDLLAKEKLQNEIRVENVKERDAFNQEVTTLENDLFKIKRTTEVAIHKAQIDMDNGKLDLKVAEIDYLIAKRAHDSEKTRLKLGLTSQMELLKTEANLRIKADAVVLSQLQLFESIDAFEKEYDISKIK